MHQVVRQNVQGLGDAGDYSVVGGLFDLAGSIAGSFLMADAAKSAAKEQRKAITGAAAIGAQAQMDIAQGIRVSSLSFAPIAVGALGLLAITLLLR